MNVEIIKMDPRIARIHYNDYRKRCRANREARKKRIEDAAGEYAIRQAAELQRIEREDQELLKAYRALYRGQQIIDVVQAVRKAGVDPVKRLPLLAICRADYESVIFRTGSNAHTDPRPYRSRGDASSVVPSNAYPAEITNAAWRTGQNLPSWASALVPIVPAQLRPDDLSKYYILWEAEWKAEAPKDPLLLSRVNATMFSVVAQWDLTPLEQRVLEGRL